MQGEIEFPFDISSFMNKAKQMEQSVASISKKMDGFGKVMTNSVTKGIVGAVAKIGLLVGAFKTVMKNIPEIGQTFKMASEIISKEFFFPIKQMLMPYLQKILDWTRDHRAMFAKWGNSVAQVIKVVINVGKELWKTFKNVANILINTLQKGLGTSFKSIDEFINVLSVKVSVITILLGDMITSLYDTIAPVFEYIIKTGAEILKFFGDLLGSWLELNENGDSLSTVFGKLYDVFDKIVHIIGDSLAGFIEGLFDPLKKIMTPLDNVAESFQRLLSIFGEGDNSKLRGAFKWLGGFVGNTLLVAFEALAVAIDTIVTGIMTLAQSGNVIKDIFTGNWGALKEDFEPIKQLWKEYGERTSASGGRMAKAGEDAINDGIVTKDGKVVHLNPNDNVYAFKGVPSMGTSITAPMNMTFNVTVTEGNAQIAGQNLGISIHQSFVERLKMQQMAEGF